MTDVLLFIIATVITFTMMKAKLVKIFHPLSAHLPHKQTRWSCTSLDLAVFSLLGEFSTEQQQCAGCPECPRYDYK